MHVNKYKADQMPASLSVLLRRSLNISADLLITLREECELTAHHLEIERMRLAARSNIHWNTQHECLDAYLPTFVLQPSFQNATVRSISKRIQTSTLSITSRKNKIKQARAQAVIFDRFLKTLAVTGCPCSL